MNAKFVIAAIIAFAMLFAGVSAMAGTDAEEVTDPAGGSETVVEEPTTVTGPIPFYAEFGSDKIVKWFNLDSTDGTIVLPTPEALGMSVPKGIEFGGWYVVKDDETADTAGACYNPGTKLTLSDSYGFSAKVTIVTYEIVFKDASGAVIDIRANENLTHGSEITLPDSKYSTPKEGQLFVGWFDADGNELVPDSNGKYIVTEDATYTAVFKDDAKVTFVVDGIVTYVGYANTISYPTDPVKDSHTFAGWAINGEIVLPAGAGTNGFNNLNITEDTIFFAVFEPAIYTVSFVVDGDVVATQTVKHGDMATEPAFIPALEGMDFVKWDFDFTQAITGDTTIEAVFEPTPEPEPTGLSNPTVQIMAIAIGVLAIFIVAVLVWKKDDVRVIIVKKLDKSKKPEDPKQ